MMQSEAQQLRIQLYLVGGLFLLCWLGAIVVATQREFAESFMRESYKDIPEDLKTRFKSLTLEGDPLKAYAGLSPLQRELLYDYWMSDHTTPQHLPATLSIVDFALFAKRVERTLVCGNEEQRTRALDFCRLSLDVRFLPTLREIRLWAERRKLTKLSGDIEQVAQVLQATAKSPSQVP